MICDWSRNSRHPLSQSDAKIKPCVYFDIFLCSDWSLWLLWFWFYDTQSKSALKTRPNARNISTQHLATLCRARNLFPHVWPPCSNMLQDVGSSLKMVKFLPTFLDVARCCARLASSFITSHNTIQQWGSLLPTMKELTCVQSFFLARTH